MKTKFVLGRVIAVLVVALLGVTSVSADVVEFDFQGNGGFGLLPDNEVGDNTSVGSGSLAIGGELATGVVYDPGSQFLSLVFEFEGLDGGLLFDAASGIHLHEVTDPSDPFNSTGPIVFNLNSFDDPNVINFNSQLADGTVDGQVNAIVNIGDDFEDALLAGELYLNIHSQVFSGGVLRANLVPTAVVPEPASGVILLSGLVALVARRRR